MLKEHALVVEQVDHSVVAVHLLRDVGGSLYLSRFCKGSLNRIDHTLGCRSDTTKGKVSTYTARDVIGEVVHALFPCAGSIHALILCEPIDAEEAETCSCGSTEKTAHWNG